MEDLLLEANQADNESIVPDEDDTGDMQDEEELVNF